MKTRVLIAALLVGTVLVAAFSLAGSYLTLSYAANALAARARPKAPADALRAVAPPASPSAPAAPAPLPVAPLDQAETQPETDGEHLMRAAMEKDPDIAALVNDRDPKISAAMRAFFVDDARPTPTTSP